MALNKKSQAIFLYIMLGIIVFIIAMAFAPILREEVTAATNTTYLNAANSSMDIEDKATVIILDMGIFYYIGIMIAASLAYITGKKSITGTITAIMVFVVVSVLITPLKDLIILMRDADHLYCTDTAITVGTKLACIVVDIWLFYFVVAAIAAGISYIFIKKALPKITGGQ